VSRLIAWLAAAFAVVLSPVAIALVVEGERRGLDLPPDRSSELYLKLATAFAGVLFAVVGLLIARKVWSNPIGWIFLVTGDLFALVSVAYGYADVSLYGDAGWWGGVWAAWLASWLVIVPAFVAPCVVAQLFPGGRPLPGPRWRRLFGVSLLAAAYIVLPASLGPGSLASYPTTDNPTALPEWVGTALLDPVWAVSIFVLLGISLVSVAVRFRHARGTERQQLTWIALVAGITIAGLVLSLVFYDISPVLVTAATVVAVAGLVSMPVAVALAILRYRLYDIDRLVSRTLTYGALTMILGLAYVGLVLAGQALFSSVTGGSNLAVAVSTLVVAALFLPLRARIQRVVDRRFNRSRYDAQRTLEIFGVRLREQLDLEMLTGELRGAVGDTMQPAHVSLWLRAGARR
jgi:hypothetical protein